MLTAFSAVKTQCTLRFARLLWVALLVLSPQCLAQTMVAKVERVIGQASAQLPGSLARALKRGDPVYLGDRLTTARGSMLLLGFNDRTQLALGESTRMAIREFSGPDSAQPSFLAEIARGVFRVVTGLIAGKRPAAVKVVTPTATIGVRGTHFGGETDGAKARIVLLEPVGEDRSAIEVSNPFGAVAIEEPGFGTEIPDAQSPPSAPRRMRLRALDNLVRTLSTIQRMPPRLPR